MSWCTIESDPGVFTSLIEDIGTKGIQVEELYSLDEASFQHISPVYGLIFLFKWSPVHAVAPTTGSGQHQFVSPDLFFAKQVITNACATQAILAILLNLESPHVVLGDTLSEFKAFTREFPPDLKGLAISNSDTIRTVHNSFARAEPFVIDEDKRPAKDDDEVYHFVAYVPFQGKVYELDGLSDGPVCLGDVASLEPTAWLKVATPVIQRRIEKYASSEIRFNLMGLVRNRVQLAQDNIAALLEQEQTAAIVGQIQSWQQCIATEAQKRANWKKENLRRKHNYVPFVIKLLQTLAKKGQLDPLLQAQLEKATAAQQHATKA
ncbi:hypothetical protein H310_08294 [Aphanomyces invadans]|uniref:Ubiquitin carboxyl-terminal hydrolase n=1 Tax=Aphanomyces invadans TaxID=157072 RepID=A0A024TXQ8_9STRA|nr:hypothetical protein H310_08294 [Aphanomyces invadans]ETV98784.1 hypothetical protein H310_08294 [Aphanomyces invadans]|eukprot:XP_008872212.1 hypothetical protein H310_08294 [Aphanomyces invadans]